MSTSQNFYWTKDVEARMRNSSRERRTQIRAARPKLTSRQTAEVTGGQMNLVEPNNTGLQQ